LLSSLVDRQKYAVLGVMSGWVAVLGDEEEDVDEDEEEELPSR